MLGTSNCYRLAIFSFRTNLLLLALQRSSGQTLSQGIFELETPTRLNRVAFEEPNAKSQQSESTGRFSLRTILSLV